MIIRLSDLGIQVPFGVNAASDNHNPSQVIADVQAGGLGLPDRDYYLKTEERFKDARAKYLVHVANMFQLAGYSEADSRKAAEQVMQFETALAKATLDNVARRDPQATDHQTTYAQLQQLTPHFDWNGYYKDANLPRVNLNVQEPKFMEEFDRQLSTTPLPDWKIYLTWQLLHGSAPYLSQPFVQENFNFYEKTLGGVGELKPRWKQCVESTDQLLGEALGQDYVARYFPPEAKARAQEMVKNILAAMGDTINGLDWMTPDTKKKAMEKIATFNVKVGYPDKWKDYSHVVITRGSYFDDVMAGAQFAVQRRPLDHRQAGRSRALGHDASDLQRLLQSTAERNRLSRWNPAATGLQREGDRRGQLWCHRRGHRARDQPRLRRPRCAVRFAWAV